MKTRKSIRRFIAGHRAELDSAINSALFRHDGRGGQGTIPNPPPVHNDTERHEWILNDEGLYRWARSEGVRI